jgi:UDP-glucose 4-epimerase
LANVRESIIKPQKYIDINLIGSLNLLELSKKNNIKGFTFASSGGCVYGQSKKIPTLENAAISPLDPYGATKSNFETYLDIYQKLHGINYTSLRYSNVYGPRQNPFGEAGVISIFSKLLLNNSHVTINGDGENIRDFVYIDDVVEANILSMKKSSNCSLNVGSGKGITINNLYKNLKKIIGSDLRPFYGSEKDGEVKKSTLNITKINKLYGWKPKTKLNKGLIKTIEYIKRFE